jgi:hypothetical protein
MEKQFPLPIHKLVQCGKRNVSSLMTYEGFGYFGKWITEASHKRRSPFLRIPLEPSSRKPLRNRLYWCCLNLINVNDPVWISTYISGKRPQERFLERALSIRLLPLFQPSSRKDR